MPLTGEPHLTVGRRGVRRNELEVRSSVGAIAQPREGAASWNIGSQARSYFRFSPRVSTESRIALNPGEIYMTTEEIRSRS
jgi:hypothetical protein